MKTIPSRTGSLFISLVVLFVSGASAEEDAKGKDSLQSLGEYRAEFVPLEGEGEAEGTAVIWKGGEKVAEIPASRPVSFSPVADVLLLAMHAPDDDPQHFLLK